MNRILLICKTPLQVLICKSIIKSIERNHVVLIDFIYITDVYNDKHKYYSSYFFDNSESNYLLITNDNRIKYINDFILLKKHINLNMVDKRYDLILLANINCSYSQMIISKVDFKSIRTFDDGFANLIPNDYFFKNDNYSAIRKFSKRVFGIRYSKFDIARLSQLHYTIFRNNKNITDSQCYIELIDSYNYKSEDNKEINVFLGQPIPGLNPKEINNIILEHNIDMYIPHPRERYELKINNTIDTPLIAEDYILTKLLLKGYTVNLFSFFSTTLMILKDFQNVNCYALRRTDLYNEHKHVYSVIETNNIEIIDVDL